MSNALDKNYQRPISDLGLSPATAAAVTELRFKPETVIDLARYSVRNLWGSPTMTVPMVREIKESLSAKSKEWEIPLRLGMARSPSPLPLPIGRPTRVSRSTLVAVRAVPITLPTTTEKVGQFSIVKLELTPRAEQVFLKAGVRKINDLLALTERQAEKVARNGNVSFPATKATIAQKGEEWGVDMSFTPEKPGMAGSGGNRFEVIEGGAALRTYSA
jgi:hypothetical protein